MTDAEAPVTYSVRDGVATLVLNRPSRKNARTTEMEGLYFDLLERADDDMDVGVVVVTGAAILQVLEREGHRDDFREGVQSLVEKRRPSFANLGPLR